MTPVLYSCAFVPSEWIAAHGLGACRAVPSLGSSGGCGSQTGMCPYARAFAGCATAAGDSAAVVFTTTCDQMRRAAELVRNDRRGPLFLLNVPATWQTPAAEQLFKAELQRFSRFLRDLGGHEPDMYHASDLPHEPRALARADHPIQPISRPPEPTNVIRLAVAGGPLAADSSFHRQVAQAGAAIVLDATDSGERMRPGPIDRKRFTHDPLDELVRAYLAMPSIHQRPNHRLLAWLRREMVCRGVSGLILRRYVWCDLWHAEVPRITAALDVPVLDLQVDGDDEATDARTAGRIGSFVEMLAQSTHTVAMPGLGLTRNVKR